MIHKNCGGKIVLDLSGMFIINSPSVIISPKGINPGMIQIDSNPEKKNSKLMCLTCGKNLSSKDEFESEILENCGVCNHSYPPSKIIVTDYIPSICTDCINQDYSDSPKKAVANRDSMQRRYLSLYGEALHKENNPTLLTILMKK